MSFKFPQSFANHVTMSLAVYQYLVPFNFIFIVVIFIIIVIIISIVCVFPTNNKITFIFVFIVIVIIIFVVVGACTDVDQWTTVGIQLIRVFPSLKIAYIDPK